MSELKKSISVELGVFSSRDLKKASIALLNTLGYRSQKTLAWTTPEAFLEQFDRRSPLRRDKALTSVENDHLCFRSPTRKFKMPALEPVL